MAAGVVEFQVIGSRKFAQGTLEYRIEVEGGGQLQFFGFFHWGTVIKYPFLHCFNRGIVTKSLENMLGDSYYAHPRLFDIPE